MKPTRQGRPKKFEDRNDLPTETSGYYIKRDDPGVVDKVTSWWAETDPNFQYIGIGNPKDRMAKHEKNGTYDPDRDHIEVIPMKQDATYDELRTWEQEKIAEHRPVKNRTQGGEGRTPNEFRNYSDDSEDSEDSDEGECRHCWNPAALACPNGCCGDCCSGCNRHGW